MAKELTLEQMFEKFAMGESELFGDGLYDLAVAIGNRDDEDPLLILVCEQMCLERIAPISKEQFIAGCESVGCYTIEDLTNLADELREQFENDSEFWDSVYLCAYSLYLTSSSRFLDNDTVLNPLHSGNPVHSIPTPC